MAAVGGENLVKAFPGACVLAKAHAAQTDQVQAVNPAAGGEIVIKELQVRQRDGKIVDLYLVIIVLLSIGDELVEAAPGMRLIAQCPGGHALIEDHVGRLIVVVHGRGGFLIALCRLSEAGEGDIIMSQSAFGLAQEIIEMIVLFPLQLALAQFFRIAEGTPEHGGGGPGVTLLKGDKADTGQCKGILAGDFPFAALPGMEVPVQNEIECLLAAVCVIEQRTKLNAQIIPCEDGGQMTGQEPDPAPKVHVQFPVQLMQFKENARIAFIQPVGGFHAGPGLLRVPGLIVIGEGKIAPDRGKVRIKAGGLFPARYGLFVLAPVIPQAPQVIGGFCIAFIVRHGVPENLNVLKPVREAVEGIRRGGGLECRICCVRIAKKR